MKSQYVIYFGNFSCSFWVSLGCSSHGRTATESRKPEEIGWSRLTSTRDHPISSCIYINNIYTHDFLLSVSVLL